MSVKNIKINEACIDIIMVQIWSTLGRRKI